ncbi:GTP 3',8-cyclase MoaA [Varunaivibrio sulfuroxidans]|uniref:GTP 3',8-cyclase n=1 Tax=Varunaivibrio sulfuroxidans TaxID=1773489 RepID=A0A4V2UN81_9PROT|nr:GTP 3',8-cyclase MoaA [Varunaivibrio sulfuroxidans]TCS61001.1 cyclic pyranopterin monophosphate synthase subunit MoaA [Varunaivibrio sulfuroxidans]WES31593.1 GTP 3',8-cyclase MoaA [Varunaivibrio sulfuroxidans]
MEKHAHKDTQTPSMTDPFGRRIRYLRVSVTDRCDFRCQYCMSEDMTFLPKADILSLEELDRVCSAFIRRGVKKLRLTGGEPLVRRGVMDLVRELSRHLRSGALEELTLTTNASQLAKYAHQLAGHGVKRVNVSLDTLDPKKFAEITRRGALDKVLSGIDAARDAGLKIKINTVALRGFNEFELDDLVIWCAKRGFDLTFIETMPLGDIGGDRTEQYLPLSTVRARLSARWTLVDNSHFSGGPARYVTLEESGQRIGFITPMTHNFCDTCNRVRITATGKLYMCLGQDSAVDLREPLRHSESDVALNAAIDKAIALKPRGHDFTIEEGRSGPAVARHMSVTGG